MKYAMDVKVNVRPEPFYSPIIFRKRIQNHKTP